MNHPCQYNICVSLWNRSIRYQQTTPNLSIVGGREHKSMACMMTAPFFLLAGRLPAACLLHGGVSVAGDDTSHIDKILIGDECMAAR